MRRVALGALLATIVAIPAVAQMEEVDTDGDGMASLEELQIVYPELTEDEFATLDANSDGMLDADEMTAGIDDGTLVAVDTE
ncbi:EF-hand domain-containing protein [Histidinibacterium aquaticum]|uniref:EF-hand domain-containing protein n=1 Tax=Histidinibacterium aquaticum TaxID=2613962 RepID=A0A5J5GA89_9RHOB|nr:hypothetical protein [Histidinibacterium aquaticum]KAA9005007.1 hypothetical protein F3S47_19085 [Histidinibacterium aquaticum]